VACADASDCWGIGIDQAGAPLVFATNSVAAPEGGGITLPEVYAGLNPSEPCFSCYLKAQGAAAQSFVGEPINTATGDFYESVPLFSLPGRGIPISFALSYDAEFAQSQVESGATSPGPDGWGWTDNYQMSVSIDSASYLATIRQENGSQIGFTPSSASACPSSYTAVAPRITTTLSCATVSGNTVYSLTSNGGLSVDAFTYNSSSQLTKLTETDANGYVTTVLFAQQGSNSMGANYNTACPSSATTCTVVTDPASRTFVLEYNSSGQLSGAVDPDGTSTGHTWSFGYDGNGNLTSITDRRGKVTSFGYDTANSTAAFDHDMTSMTPPNGQTGGSHAGDAWAITYDSLGRVSTQTDPQGLETSLSYFGNNLSPEGGTTTITDPHGNVEQDTYAYGILTSVTKAAGTAPAATWTYQRDPATLMPTTVIDPNGHITTSTDDSNGNLLSVQDARGHTATTTYNSFNEPLVVTDRMGITTTSTYDADGNIQTKAVQGIGGSPTETTYYTYDDGHAGDLTQVKDPDGHITAYTYDSYGDVVSTTTYPGNSTTATSSADHFTYSSPVATISAVGSLANTAGTGVTTLSVSPQHSGDLMALLIKDSSSSITTSSVSGGGVSTWTRAEGPYTGYASHDLELWTGTVTTTGSSTVTVTFSGSVSSIHTGISAQEFSASSGSSTTWGIDTGAGKSNASSTTVTYPTLTPAGSGELYFGYAVVANTGSGGSTSGFTYATSTDGDVAAYDTSVSSSVTPTASQSPAGVSGAVAIFVTASGSSSTTPTVTAVSPTSGYTPGGTSVTVTGTNFIAVTAVTFGATAATSFTVTSPTSITALSPAGSSGTVDVTVSVQGLGVTSDSYNTLGQRYCEVSPNANASGVSCPSFGSSRVADTSTWAYDFDGNVSTAFDANGNETQYAYDADGNRTQVTDPLTNVTTTAYDADDRVSSVTNTTASQTIASYTYDVVPGTCPANPTGTTYCTEVENGLSQSTTSYYNALDQMIEQDSPSTTNQTATTYTYDGAGNVLTKTDGSGTATYTYNPDNQVSGIAYSNTASGYSAPSAVGYQYDNDGQRTQMTDGSGTTTYAYDSLERLDSVTNGATHVVTYGYDADGNTTCISYPNSGSTTCPASSGTGIVTYAYDGAGNEISMTDWLGSGNVTTFAYDQDGNLTQTTLPSGTTTSVSNSYDNAAALTDTSYKIGSTTTNLAALSRNADELIGSMTPSSGGATTYGYDPLNRVTTGTAASYTYDAASQITSVTPSGSSATDFSYNTDGQLCWTASSTGSCSSPPGGATTFSYSSAGERLNSQPPSSGHPTTYGWDQAGDLVCETKPNSSSYSCSSPNSTVTSTYAYNGDGLRMSDTPAGLASQQFTWDVGGSVPQLLEDGTNYYLYGANVGSAPIEQISITGSTPTYLVSDTTGVREQVGSTGSVVGSMTYDSYGNQCSTCSISTPFGFEGGYTDATGLDYLVHRYYDTATGQFVSVDPLVDATGTPYAFTGGDPVNGSDPLGLCNSQGNGNAWDLVNPFSNNNPLRCWAQKHPTGGKVVVAVTGVSIAAAACYLACPAIAALGAADEEGNPSAAANLWNRCSSFFGDEAGAVGPWNRKLPSWVLEEGYGPEAGESPVKAATRIMNERFGEGNWSKGPTSDFNIIVKWITRTRR
jgi:RHS repeat-associated protein